MSQAREKLLRQIALYCRNHASIDVDDVVAFYAQMSTPGNFPYTVNIEQQNSSLGAEGFAVWEKVVGDVIADIKSKDPEEFEGAYSAAMQAKADEGDLTPHYYCSKVCFDFR